MKSSTTPHTVAPVGAGWVGGGVGGGDGGVGVLGLLQATELMTSAKAPSSRFVLVRMDVIGLGGLVRPRWR